MDEDDRWTRPLYRIQAMYTVVIKLTLFFLTELCATSYMSPPTLNMSTQFVEVGGSVQLQLNAADQVNCWMNSSWPSCGLATRASNQALVQYQMNTAGKQGIHFSCRAEVGGDVEDTNSVQIFVFERLSGFQSKPDSRKISARDLSSDQAMVNFTFSAGRYLSANYSTSATAPGEGTVMINDITLSGYFTFVPQDFTSFGSQAVSAHFHNTLKISDDCCSSSDYESVEFIVKVEEEINNVEYMFPNLAVYNTSLQLSASSTDGSNVFYKWSSDFKVWEICFQSGSSSRFNILPLSFNPIQINVALSNFVSYVEKSKTIDIVRRVEGFTAKFDSPYIIIQSPTEEFFPMGELSIEVRSAGRLVMSKEPSIISPNTTSWIELTGLTKFPNLFLILASEVSQQKIQLVDKKELEVTVAVQSPYGMLGDSVTIIFNNSVGPGFRYTLDTGDGISLSKDLQSETVMADFTYNHTYSKPGLYTIYLSASTADQERNSSVSVTIVGVGLWTDPIVTLPSGSAQVRVVIQATLQASRSLTCDLNFGDESDSVKVVHQSNAQHTYRSLGTFNVTLTCPFLPGKTVGDHIIVKEFFPSDFKFNYNKVVMKNLSAVDVEFHIELFGVKPVPPGVVLMWNFTDGTPSQTATLTSWLKTHSFANRGNYNIQVTIKTAPEVSGTFSLPVQIGVVQFLTRDTKGLQAIDAFKFQLSKLPSPVANVSLNFGDGTSEDFVARSISPDTVFTVDHVYKTLGQYRPLLTVWADAFYEEIHLNNILSVVEAGPALRISINPFIYYPPGIGTLLFMAMWEAYVENITCQVDFNDGSVTDIILNVSLAKSRPVSYQHHFGAMGQLEVTANCSGRGLPSQYLQTETYVTSKCYRSGQSLFNFDNPIRRLVSEQLIISARVDIECVNMTAVFSWQVNRLDGGQYTTAYSVHSNTSLLVLPARSMTEGIYGITFYTYFMEMPSLHKTDSVNVIYEHSPLVAWIKGGTLKALGESHEITVDAITLSHDPDVPPESPAGLTFRWSMSSHGSLSDAMSAAANGTKDFCLLCSRVSHWTTGLLVFTPGCLGINQWTIFHVVVSKGSRKSSAYQIIYVSSGSRPQIDLKCKVNCMEKVNAEFSFSLESECLNCNETERHHLIYDWRLYRTGQFEHEIEPLTTFEEFTGTGTTISTLAIRPYTFTPGETYVLLFSSRLAQKQSTVVRRHFTVNYPPYNGTCHVTPTEGYAVYDRFQVICEGWIDEADRTRRSEKDDDKYLQYRFILQANGRSSLLYAGGSRMTTKQQFNIGDKNDDYSVRVTVRIFDSYKGMAEVNLTVRVLSPLSRLDQQSESHGLVAMLDDFSLEVDRALATGDIHDVLRMAEAAGSTLQSLDWTQESSALEADGDDWLSDKPPDVNGGRSARKWKDLWEEYRSPEQNDDQHHITLAKVKYLEVIATSVNGSDIASLDTVYMASTSVRTLLDSPDDVLNDGKNAAVDTLDKLGNRLTGLVTEDMSDTQVNEILDSVLDAVDKSVTGITPSHPIVTEDLDVQNSIKELDMRRKYLTKLSLAQAQEKLETADINDEERAFFSTRRKLRQNYMNNKRKAMAKERIPKLQRAVDQVLNSASTFMVDGQQPLEFTAQNMACSVQRKRVKDILNEDIRRHNVRMRLRRKGVYTTEELEQEISNVATLKTTIFNKNPFTWANEETVARITSPTVLVNLTLDEPSDEPDNTQVVNYDVSLPNLPPVKVTTVSPTYLPMDADQMLYHRLELKSISDTLLVSLKPSVVPVVYDLYFRAGEFPTSAEHHYHTAVRYEKNVTKIASCPPGSLPSAGTVFLGLKPTPLDHPRLRRDLSPQVSGQGQLNSGSSEDFSKVKRGNYEVGMAATSCTQWADPGINWDSDTCKMNNVSSLEKTSCACDLPLSSIFTIATTFYLPVNMVDFSTVFTEIDLLNNASVFAMVIFMLGVYVLLVIWARRKDKTDIIKWGITALVDNAPGHNYLYIITVYTGMRMSAGTKSKVGFVIAGEKGDTGVRPLNDGIRNGFPKQSVMHYLMTVESCLGDLQYLRIWHDNSGKGTLASWFLHKVVVEDLQEDKKYVFKCDDWLGVDESDGLIERLLPVSSKENLLTFSSLFYNNARKNVTDSHIWFSVLFRPQRSHFTRVQRLSCCACLLFLSMICNALFYQGGENVVQPTTIRLGFLRLSLHQVYTSFITICIVTPVELALIWLFKKSKPEWNGSVELVSAEGGCHSCFISKERVQMANALLSKGFLKPKGALLPHFCIYIAWVMVLICISTSAFFVFLLSQQWGRAKSEEWLTSFLLTFFESLIILDPLKVVLVAIFFAMFVHKLEEDSNDLNKDEIRSNCGVAIKKPRAENSDTPVKPLEAEEVEKVRALRLKETKTFEVIKEIGLYLLFLAIMCSIGYTNRDNRSFSLKKNLENMLVNTQQDGRLGLKDVKTVEQYFSWLNKTAFPALFHEVYDNHSRRSWGDRFFIRDLQNLRVGPPRLRQVRAVHASVCAVPGISLEVCDTFSVSRGEDDTDYCIGWKPEPCDEEERAFKLSSKAWKYTSTSEVWGMPVIGVYNTYTGGGYIAELNINLDVSTAVLQELFSASWVDMSTRLLTLDFTVYNANTNLFCFASLRSEFPGTGGTITTAIVLPFRVYQYAGTLGNFVFFTEIMFIILLSVAVIKVVLKMVKHGVKYLRDFWHVVDFVSLVACFVAIAMYGLRKFSTEMALHSFQMNGRQFVNFQQVTFWDSMMIAMVGIVTFTCTVRTVKILGFSRRLDAILTVLNKALKDLLYFSLMFFIFLMAFVTCGYFLFGQDLKAYHTVLTTCETLMTSLVGKSPFSEVRNNEPIMAQIYFSCFVFFFVFVLLTMFQVILNQSIALVRLSKDFTSIQHEMVQVLLSKLKPFLCLFSRRKEERHKGNIFLSEGKENVSKVAPYQTLINRHTLQNRMSGTITERDTELSSTRHRKVTTGDTQVREVKCF